MAPLPRQGLQPVVSGAEGNADVGIGTEGTVCVLGRRVKVATLVSMFALAITIAIASISVIRTWGFNEGRINALENKSTEAHSVQEQVRGRLGSLEAQQAATQSTVESIKSQQSEDRRHFDARLDRLYEAVTRSR